MKPTTPEKLLFPIFAEPWMTPLLHKIPHAHSQAYVLEMLVADHDHLTYTTGIKFFDKV